MYQLGKRSRSKLVGVHPDLVRVVEHAIQITEQDFAVIEGLRTLERQRRLVKIGASKTLNSRHLTGHAVDLAAWSDGRIDWNDYQKYKRIGAAMFEAATELGVSIRWGADWNENGRHDDERFLDWVHFELHRSVYA